MGPANNQTNKKVSFNIDQSAEIRGNRRSSKASSISSSDFSIQGKDRWKTRGNASSCSQHEALDKMLGKTAGR